MSRPIILDISFWQENQDTKTVFVDFNKMKESGADGVILRVGQATWEDKQFEQYWKNSQNSGLLRGAYWYYDNTVSPKIQAEKCTSILKRLNCKLEMPLFLDFEDRRSYEPYHGWKNWYDFIESIKKSIPEISLGIYTGYYYWQEFKPQDYAEASYFGKYPLWIAQYPYETVMQEELYTEPKIPPMWKTWMFWQISDRGDGKLYGVESSRVDVNYFNGTREEFRKYFSEVPNSNSGQVESPTEGKGVSEVYGVYGSERIKYKEA